MTFLISKMTTRSRDISNELSGSPFGVEEGLQTFPTRAHSIFASPFCTFLPILGELIFEGLY